MGETKKVGGRHSPGRIYTKPLIDMLPEIIGRKAKTIAEIADEAQRAEQTVRQLVDRLMQESNRRIHIKGWQRGICGGRITARYSWGSGKDAKRPSPLTRAEITKRYQQTDKGKQAKNRYLSKKKGACVLISATINKNPLMAAIYG